MIYFGPPGVPSFSALINIDDANATREKFVAQYTNIKFHNLSSTYSLTHEIDYDKKKVIRWYILTKYVFNFSFVYGGVKCEKRPSSKIKVSDLY